MTTILVVEDAEAVRHFIAVALRQAGYDVIEAETVAEARTRFAAIGGRVALVLSDVVLTDGTGPELYRVLAATNPGLRLLLMSGYPSAELTPRLADGSLSDVLLKPFGLTTLIAKVRAALHEDRL